MTRIEPNDERLRRAVESIRRWDGSMKRALAEPLIFISWLRELNRGLYADDLGPAFGQFWRLHPVFVRRALTGRTAWCDDTRTEFVESCDRILEQALTRALDDLTKRFGEDPGEWRWGRAHVARFPHPLLGQVPVLKRLSDIEIESDGGAYTVNRGQHWTANETDPFASRHGAVYRAVLDLSRLDSSKFMQPTGQSGNLLSPHYDDLIERWRDGRFVEIPASRAGALDGAVGVLNLVPAK